VLKVFGIPVFMDFYTLFYRVLITTCLSHLKILIIKRCVQFDPIVIVIHQKSIFLLIIRTMNSLFTNSWQLTSTVDINIENTSVTLWPKQSIKTVFVQYLSCRQHHCCVVWAGLYSLYGRVPPRFSPARAFGTLVDRVLSCRVFVVSVRNSYFDILECFFFPI